MSLFIENELSRRHFHVLNIFSSGGDKGMEGILFYLPFLTFFQSNLSEYNTVFLSLAKLLVL